MSIGALIWIGCGLLGVLLGHLGLAWDRVDHQLGPFWRWPTWGTLITGIGAASFLGPICLVAGIIIITACIVVFMGDLLKIDRFPDFWHKRIR